MKNGEGNTAIYNLLSSVASSVGFSTKGAPSIFLVISPHTHEPRDVSRYEALSFYKSPPKGDSAEFVLILN